MLQALPTTFRPSAGKDKKIANQYGRQHWCETRTMLMRILGVEEAWPRTTMIRSNNGMGNRGQGQILWQEVWSKTIYPATISARDNFCGEKLLSEGILVDGWTIFVARHSKKSGSKGSPRTIFVAKSLHKDNFCDILQYERSILPCNTNLPWFHWIQPKTS